MTETATITLDPYITSTDYRVRPGEMATRHNVAADMSGAGTTVLVQDSGLDPSHPDIELYVDDIEFHDFSGAGHGDDVGHGTMVTDTVATHAPGVDVIVHRVFGSEGSAGLEPFMDSFRWAEAHADHIDAIVMSWGTSQRVIEIDGYVNRLADKGVVPFAAAGNSGGTGGSPATAKRAIAVGALQGYGNQMTNFSSWDQDGEPDPGLGGNPDVCAIGKNVVGARASGTSMGIPIDEYHTVASGTSFSNPFVAAVGLDLLRREPGLSPGEVLHRLESTADDIDGTHRDGLGRVNGQRAVGGGDTHTVNATVWSTPSGGGDDFIHVDRDVLDDGEYEVDPAALADAFEPID